MPDTYQEQLAAVIAAAAAQPSLHVDVLSALGAIQGAEIEAPHRNAKGEVCSCHRVHVAGTEIDLVFGDDPVCAKFIAPSGLLDPPRPLYATLTRTDSEFKLACFGRATVTHPATEETAAYSEFVVEDTLFPLNDLGAAVSAALLHAL